MTYLVLTRDVASQFTELLPALEQFNLLAECETIRAVALWEQDNGHRRLVMAVEKGEE